MWLIVGLGNPGKKYEKTRHNVGFLVVDTIAREHNLTFSASERCKGELAKGTVNGSELIFLKPSTMMNRSGLSVKKTTNNYQLTTDNLVIIHDDVDLPFGEIRVSMSSGSAGHKGVDSVIETLGTQVFTRLRIGIGRPDEKIPVESYVLQDFSREESEELGKIIIETHAKLLDLLHPHHTSG